MNDKMINLFVPGRLCLIGEHSDWAGLYKTINSNIIPGKAIVTGIEQGIYARATVSENFSIDYEIEKMKDYSFNCPMNSDKLKEIAKQGEFFSYCAGVASYVKEHYNVKGVHITVTKMDLPMKNGLSSSATICVLVARAFNKLYNLNCNIMGEMLIAYYGEQRTPSRCGRLDQACAYGIRPVSMTFEGNEISVKPLNLKKPMYFVIVNNLKKNKNTKKILADLNKCFPFPETKIEKKVCEALGKDNEIFVNNAIELIENGYIESFGKLMTEYQINFDKKVAPACLSELEAPILHSILNDKNLKKWSYGSKGVGSQGDGSAQILAKDENCQKEIVKYLKEKGFDSFTLTLSPSKKIHKAVIPVAGFGTRLFPITKYLKKDFLPIMDKDGILKPVILILIEQLLDSGIDEICLVIGEDERQIYDSFFKTLSKEYYEKLPEDKRKYEDFIESIQEHITFVIQNEKLGLGHAVFQTIDFAADEPVLLILGDMIYSTNSEKNCMFQMIEIYEKYEKPVISMHTVDKSEVVHYGIMTGDWSDKEQKLLKIKEMCEKPSVEYAEKHLSVSNKESQQNFYSVFGQYIITKEIYEQLRENIENKIFEKGEIQLTTAFEQVCKKTDVFGFLVDGISYDIGIPEAYVKTMSTFGIK